MIMMKFKKIKNIFRERPIFPFQKNFKVYQQAGKKCKNLGCSDYIKKNFISNRATFFCDSCQK